MAEKRSATVARDADGPVGGEGFSNTAASVGGMKVLLGIGGSDDSIRALEKTAERAADTGDDLTVAIVENPSVEHSREDIEQKVTTVLDEFNLDAPIQHLEGDPGSALVDKAENEGFDQLVLGGGQTSPMGKIQVGSIAEFVLLNSHVTVTLVR